MSYLISALVIQLLCIPVVILIFRLWEKIPASFVATALFVVIGAWSLMAGLKSLGWRGLSVWGALQFLVFFAFPIALMRVMHPSQELGELHLGPISAAKLHGFSNISFVLMMLFTAVDLLRVYRFK